MNNNDIRHETLIDVNAMVALGESIGRSLEGGEVIELIGDVGAGKTTFVKGLAKGLEIAGDIQSPTFTISRVYEARDGLQLAHYDFYRLADAGIMAEELHDSLADKQTVTVIEWGDIVADVLPNARITFRFVSPSETTRDVEISGL